MTQHSDDYAPGDIEVEVVRRVSCPYEHEDCQGIPTASESPARGECNCVCHRPPRRLRPEARFKGADAWK